MSPDSTASNLNEIIELSSSMLATAREGDWEQVQEIEQKRKKLFEQTFPLDKDSITDAAALTRQIQRIADLDKQTMALMADSRKELSGLVKEIATGRQAVNAYRDVQGK
jgi:hypothetical protein